MPAPKNNKNAAKPEGEAASSHLHIRCTSKQLEQWKQAATSASVPLSRWVKDCLDRNALQ